jgi:hypothetical protein
LESAPFGCPNTLAVIRNKFFTPPPPTPPDSRNFLLGGSQGSNFIAAIAVEGEQNDVDHCGNDSNFLPYSAIFILFTVHYYFDT